MANNYADDVILRGSNSGGMVSAADNALYINPHAKFKQAVLDGRAYNWASVTYDAAAGDTILGLENNDSGQNLYIYRIWLSSAEASTCQVFTANTVTMAGTNAVTGVNLNRNYNTVALATCYDDETGNGEAASSWPGKLYMLNLLADTVKQIDVDGRIVLPNDHMVGVDFAADVTGGNVTIWGWFE